MASTASALSLQNAVSRYVIREQFCDVTLISDDFQKFPAHKLVLSAFSPVLEKLLLLSSNQKTDQTVLHIRGFNSLELQTMLRFMYRDEAWSEERNEDFRQLASYLNILGFNADITKPSETNRSHEKQPLEKLRGDYKVFNKSDISIEYLEEEEQKVNKMDDDINTALDLCIKTRVTADTIEQNGENEMPAVALRTPPADYFKLIEGVESLFECLFCDEKYLKRHGLLKHNQAKHSTIQNFECKVCLKKFKQLDRLDIHFRSYHREHLYKCIKCDLTAGRKSIIYQHYLQAHLDMEFNCKLCNFTTHTLQLLRCHVKRIHQKLCQVNCDQCGQLVARNHLRVHKEMKHSGIRFPCSTCPFQATSRQYLRVHEESQHKGVVHKCEQCDFKASTRNQLQKHIEITHEGLRFTCEYCKQDFRSKATMKRHQVKKHNVSHVFRHHNRIN